MVIVFLFLKHFVLNKSHYLVVVFTPTFYPWIEITLVIVYTLLNVFFDLIYKYWRQTYVNMGYCALSLSLCLCLSLCLYLFISVSYFPLMSLFYHLCSAGCIEWTGGILSLSIMWKSSRSISVSSSLKISQNLAEDLSSHDLESFERHFITIFNGVACYGSVEVVDFLFI